MSCAKTAKPIKISSGVWTRWAGRIDLVVGQDPHTRRGNFEGEKGPSQNMA